MIFKQVLLITFLDKFELILIHIVKSFHLFRFDTNNSIYN